MTHCTQCQIALVDDVCPQCHVHFFEECPTCQQAGYHAEGCPEIETEETMTLPEIAKELAKTAVAQGVTLDYIESPTVDLFDADIRWAEEQIGRKLSRDEKKELLSEYLNACRELL